MGGLLNVVFFSSFNSSRYVEHWIYRGRCSDPHNEFFIRPDNVQLEKRDRKYWINGFAFQPINRPGAGPFINSTAEDDAITGLLNDVYLCGKTVHLLQLCQAKVSIRF